MEANYLVIDENTLYPENTVYLTFDDGPTEWTNEILDILEKNNTVGTFFMNSLSWTTTGEFAKENNKFHGLHAFQNEIFRMKQNGHSIGSHSHQHYSFLELSEDEIRNQIDTFQKAIYDLFQYQYKIGLIRPPFGHTNQKINKLINEYGAVCLWSLESTDANEWEKGEWFKPKEGVYRLNQENCPQEYKNKCQRILYTVIDKCKQNLGQGQNILFHETHNTTVDILQTLIDRLKELGYNRFETLDKLCQKQ